jgi:hypothetical protein
MDRPSSTAPEFLDVVPTTRRRRAAHRFGAGLWLAARVLGALAVLATGAVHLHLYEGLYSHIATIGTLFLLNFLGATAIGLGLLAPVERVGPRYAGVLLVLLAAAGIALAALAFAFLLISEQTPLFGFKEPGYDPHAMAAARAAEVATVVFLGVFLVGRIGLKARMWRW